MQTSNVELSEYVYQNFGYSMHSGASALSKSNVKIVIYCHS
jgi:hypothetical protein